MALTRALDAPLTADRPRLDREGGRLAGSRCQACGTPSFPARAICHHCASADLEPEAFAPTGTLLSYTIVWVSRPGLEAPYSIGHVRLDDNGPQVFAHLRALDSEQKVPLPVTLTIAEVGAVPPYWFEPRSDDAD